MALSWEHGALKKIYMKKRILRYCCTAIFSLYSFCIFAQTKQKTNTAVFYNKDTSITEFLVPKISISDLKLCEQSVFFLKFRIDTALNITDLTYSKNVPLDLINRITRAIFETNGKWVLENKFTKSGFLLLPFFVSIHRGCDSLYVNEYFKQKKLSQSANSNSAENDLYLKAESVQKKPLANFLLLKQSESILNLFNFEKEAQGEKIEQYSLLPMVYITHSH